MLVGREDECARIDGLLEEARGGRSGALLLVGEPGIGKSALLEHAAEQAAGMTVTRAVGVESEGELQYAALLDVCRPVLDKLGELPEKQEAALGGALGLGSGAPIDRFTVAAAAMALLAAAAEARPLLVLVDDAHWLDRSSAEALLFAVRRLDADPVAVLFAARDEAVEPFTAAGVDVLRVGGLDVEAVLQLLGAASDNPPTAEIARRLQTATGGNPLALLELPALLTPQQLSGAAPLDEPIPTGPVLERAYTRRSETLPEATRRALVVAAVSRSNDLDSLVSGLRAAGLDPAALEPAEDARLIRIADTHVQFPHPLIRSAVFHTAQPSERRAAHRALAEALANRGSGDERAWHLASAALGPDEEAADALVAAAKRAAERGGDAESSAALERAARLTADDALRSLRLVDAATAALDSGSPRRAAGLADEARGLSAEPAIAARCLYLRGRAEFALGSPRAGRDLLLEAAAIHELANAAAAAESLARAVPYSIHAGDIAMATHSARRCRKLAAQDGGFLDDLAEFELGSALTFAGRAEGRAHLERAVEAHRHSKRHQDRRLAAIALVLLDRVAEAHELAVDNTRLARESGPGAVAFTSEQAAWADVRAGRWERAVVAATEGLELGRDLQVPTIVATYAALLAHVEAARGDETRARALAEESLEIAQERGLRLVAAWARSALGLLELTIGRLPDAEETLTAVARDVSEMGVFYRDIAPEPELVELLARQGRSDEARKWLVAWSERAGASGSPWVTAVEARCEAILAADDAFEEPFRAALDAHAFAEDRFAEGRTLLCFGERLRRGRRRVEAREQLYAALALFDELGAEPWAERARAELRATGETLRRREPHEEEELTPQELQIALQVAEGKTNKEVAAALFLSPKTIEFHLKRVFRKLGVRSRGELIRRFATAGDRS